MPDQILPEELIEASHIYFAYKVAVKSQIIYSLILLLFIIGIVILPFIKITVSVSSSGIIEATTEKVEISAPISGRVILNNLEDNKRVKKNELLLSIDLHGEKKINKINIVKSSQLSDFISDAQMLLGSTTAGHLNTDLPIKTNQYQIEYKQYQQQLELSQNSYTQAKRIYLRDKQLFHDEVITLQEYEKSNFDYNQARSELELTVKKFQAQLSSDITQDKSQISDLNSKQIEFSERAKLYELKAACNGTLQGISGLQANSYVFANQKIGEISPDGELYAYCMVKPADIGFIKNGQQVNLQIDAFNYNQWGFIKAKVADISDDIVEVNQQPFFRIKCKLMDQQLMLKNGYQEHIKKGMTFSGRFKITQRSLYQLLYDKIDDWMNPNNKAI